MASAGAGRPLRHVRAPQLNLQHDRVRPNGLARDAKLTEIGVILGRHSSSQPVTPRRTNAVVGTNFAGEIPARDDICVGTAGRDERA